MDAQTPGEGKGPSRGRESQAILIALAGLLLLYGFFAAGAYVGRWSNPRAVTTPPAARSASREPSTDYFLVEVEVVDSREKADALLGQIRRHYTSATVELDPSDRRYHIYVGPYDADAANTVATELKQQGREMITIKPYRQ
jgi:hypothetical protein